ncbi:MAG: hypothetical protein BGO01_08380 [Armatimonadetes bacterium 55-13]|nr:MAG: hypothetical protein BGO01_08380 [Armatimonadetes bacterium 55-13]
MTDNAVSDNHSSSNANFEKLIVSVFIFLPPIAALVVLAYAWRDPIKLMETIGLLAGLCTLVGIHIKWIRPYFRRYPWVAGYSELKAATEMFNGEHPKLVRRAWRNRILRSTYRILFAIPIALIFYGLYVLHGHHFIWFLAGYAVCGFGITVGYHRIGTHPSFKAPTPIRALFLTMGACAMQGPPAEWMKKHSKHHAFGDTSADVHSPYVFEESKRAIFKEQVLAFLHSFMMWAFKEPSLRRPKGMSIEDWKVQLLNSAPDPATFRYRDGDAYYWEVRDKDGKVIVTTETLIKKRWGKLVDTIVNIEQDKTVQVISHPAVYLSIITLSVAAPWYLGGITIWESLARVCFVNWVTFCVNSVCHLWGETPFKTPDNSKNNAVIEILALGEGGHNTHHKSELWAQHGIFAWQFDLAAVLIKSLRAVGLASNLNLPTRQEIVRSWINWRHREPEMQGYRARLSEEIARPRRRGSAKPRPIKSEL